MEPFYIKLIESLIALILVVVIRRIVSSQVVKRLERADFGTMREKLISKLLNITYIIVLVIILTGIWGLEGTQVLAFVTTTLTVVGIGFFAQWSLLSNITSGLILFFNHPLKIGDYISIVDKDFPIEGRVENISLFFLYVKDKEDRVFSISNTLVLQKTFRILRSDEIAVLLDEKEEVVQ
mgnify:CR=1 FL=1